MRIHNRKRTLIKLAIIVLSVTLAAVVFVFNGRQTVEASASGPSPTRTNAPGEGNCTACHSDFDLNSGPGFERITGIPHDYLPGHQYQITVTTSDSLTSPTGALLFGFEMTVIDHYGKRAGDFSFPVLATPKMQLKLGVVGGNTRQYIEHTSSGLFTQGVIGSNSWTFTWTAPALRVGKVGFYAAGNAANGNNNTTGDYIYTTSGAALSGTATSNFDGDLASDIAYFRPSTGAWASYNIQNSSSQNFLLGGRGDRIVPGDYDGDGKTDFAVYRPSNSTWYIQQSSLGFVQIQFGSTGDIAVPGDYDGDGITDLAVFRPSNGTWYLNIAGSPAVQWGQSTDKLVPGDYDGDGKTDIAFFRPSNNTWYIKQSTGTDITVPYGVGGDKPVPADYDGDGKTDIAVFHPATSTWNLDRSTDGDTSIVFGSATDTPVPADYDGDGKADIAGYSPSPAGSAWHIFLSSTSSTYNTVLGQVRDTPVPAAYLPK